jgi:hypothetical protein
LSYEYAGVSVLIIAAVLLIASLGNEFGGPLHLVCFITAALVLLTAASVLWLLYSVSSVCVRVSARLQATLKRDILGTIGFALAVVGAVWALLP